MTAKREKKRSKKEAKSKALNVAEGAIGVHSAGVTVGGSSIGGDRVVEERGQEADGISNGAVEVAGGREWGPLHLLQGQCLQQPPRAARSELPPLPLEGGPTGCQLQWPLGRSTNPWPLRSCPRI